MAPQRLAASNGLLAWIRARSEAYGKWRQRRATARALYALDDHLLRDIGLDRSEVMSLAHSLEADVTRRKRA
ncbi:MAG: DUF1127 domain-containing protein [Hyphomicrobiaceae bacterium]|nr:DUF1127 domain-containing protein [Hyphomicrobiaceae bacterium]